MIGCAQVFLSARGIQKQLGYRSVLIDVTLSLAGGEIVALLGANGAGKTTLLRILSLLSKPDDGTVSLHAGEMHYENAWQNKDARRHLGVVFHDSMLDPDLTAMENLRFYALLYGIREPEAKARVLLESVGLARVADRRVSTFSRGMEQRVALARALVHSPDILLLDEPFTGLDQEGRLWLIERLWEVKASGVAVLFTTHEPEAVKALATRTLHLTRGRIEETNP